ncbi:MAG: glycosyltransferase family 87 protein [Bacteroidota bacterium]|nr:glycosyltransferase family 87 protein [Bacteroidota bacterium]
MSSKGDTKGALSARFRVGLISAWTLVVFPLTFLGYGSDPDAWLVARAAHDIAKTHTYVASRSTGFPLFEILEAPLVSSGGWMLANLLPLVSGIAGLCALFRMARNGIMHAPRVTIAVFAFLPVIVKNASSTMDYMPGLALLLWAMATLGEKRRLLPAVFLGLAAGFRPTNALFLIPCLLALRAEERPGREMFRFAAVTFVTSCVSFSPALLTIGIRGSYAVMHFDILTRTMIGAYNAAALFGVQGWCAIACAILLAGMNPRLRVHPIPPRSFLVLHISVIVLWAILFALLPDEPEYLLPTVPSVMLLLDRILSKRAWVIVSLFLLSYHFFRIETAGGESGERTFTVAIRPGRTIADVQDRVFKLSVRDAAVEAHVERPTVLMYGSLWIPTLHHTWSFDTMRGMWARRDRRLFIAEKILEEKRLRRLRDEGFRLVVWKSDKWEYTRSGHPTWREYVDVVDDLETFFGRKLRGKPLTLH